MDMAGETRQLAEFTVSTSFSELPTRVVESMLGYILDNLACGIAGASRPEPRVVAEFAHTTNADGGSLVFRVPWTTSPSLAALVNGTAISALESDHGYIEGSCHPSAAVFPAALAIGQIAAVDGRDLLTALALGYEIQCRIGEAANSVPAMQYSMPFCAALALARDIGDPGHIRRNCPRPCNPYFGQSR